MLPSVLPLITQDPGIERDLAGLPDAISGATSILEVPRNTVFAEMPGPPISPKSSYVGEEAGRLRGRFSSLLAPCTTVHGSKTITGLSFYKYNII